MSPTAVAAARGDLRRARLRRVDGGGDLPIRYNPAQISIGKSGRWTATPARGASSAPQPDFVGAEPRTLGLNLTFDGPTTGRDVTKDVELLQSWCNPTQDSIVAGTPQPPLLQLDWASPAAFEAYLERANATYVLFDRDGTPLRATVEISLKESPKSASAQNPSSGGYAGHRTHVLAAGESLQSLAHRLYGDPTLWRGLARYNDVANPLGLRPGERVALPPQGVVRELAR